MNWNSKNVRRYGAAKDRVFHDPDCMYCLRCVERCPKHSLTQERAGMLHGKAASSIEGK